MATSIANVARSIPMLPAIHKPPGVQLPMMSRRATDDQGEYVTRREFEERLTQMDMRISMLANALAQQDELTQRMQAALDEVLAKTAALPPPRPARSALSGLINDGAMLDAGGNAFPDPTGGGGGGSGGGGGPGGGGGGGGVGFAPGPIGLVGLGGGGGHGGMFGLGDHDGLQHAGDDDELGDDLDGEMEMDENLDDEHLDGAGAPAGLEALAGMEAIGGAEVEVERGVGEAGMVKVPGRGMKQVRLQLRYTNPVVIACLVPPRPSSALASPDAARKFDYDADRLGKSGSGGHAAVSIPFKSATSFTVQLLPPSGTDMMGSCSSSPTPLHSSPPPPSLSPTSPIRTAPIPPPCAHCSPLTRSLSLLYLILSPSPSLPLPRSLSLASSPSLPLPRSLSPPVAYVVIESGTHVLEGGARLIAGEESVGLHEPLRIDFEQFVRHDTSFDRTPTVVCTPQVSQHAGLIAYCKESNSSGFTIGLSTDQAAAAAAGRMRKGGKEDEAQQKPPGPPPEQTPLLSLTPEGASEEEVRAVTRLQARQRGRLVRSTLQGAGSLEGHASASVGWLACDAVDALGVVSSTVPEVSLGAPCDVRFEQFGIDYPETPVLLYALVGHGAHRCRCVALDERSASVLCEEAAAESVAEGAAADSTAEGKHALGWLALPPGRLFPLAESDSEDEGGDDHHLVGDSATSLT